MAAIPDATVVVLSEPLERYLIAIEGEIKHGNRLLERLLTIEEERRQGERDMEALARAIANPPALQAEPDWYRSSDGVVMTRDEHGERRATPAEIVALMPSRKARR